MKNLMSKNTISAGGVVIRLFENNEYQVLLLRDKNYDDRIIPKGHREVDETIEETAIREIYEEGGIVGVRIKTLLGSFQRFNEKSNENKTIYYYLMERIETSKIIETEENIKFEIKRHNIDHLPRMFLEEQSKIVNENLVFIKKQLQKKPQ